MFWSRTNEGGESFKEWEVRNDLLENGLSESRTEEFVSFVCGSGSLPDWVEESHEVSNVGTVDEMDNLVYSFKE